VATLPPQVNLADPSGELVYLTVVHGNPLLDSLDVYVGNQAVLARARYKTYSNEPAEVPAGDYLLRLVPSGASNSRENALLEQDIRLTGAGLRLLLVIFGTAEAPRAQVYEQNLDPLPANTARLNLIYATSEGAPISVLADEVSLVDDLINGNMRGNVELPVGDYELNFRAGAGSLLKTPLNLSDQGVYTSLLVGAPGQGRYDSITFRQAAIPQTRFRVVNALYQGPNVRVLLDNTLVVEDLAYQAFSDRFIAFPSGPHRLRVEAMGAAPGQAPLLETELLLGANLQAELILYDRPEQAKVGLFPLPTEPVDPFQARLLVINLAIGEAAVQAKIPNRLGLGTDLNAGGDGRGDETGPSSTLGFSQDMAFGKSLEPMLISLGFQTWEFYSRQRDNSLPLLHLSPELEIEAGQTYTYILAGRQAQDSFWLSSPLEILAPEELLAQDLAATQTLAPTYFINLTEQGLELELSLGGRRLDESLAFNLVSEVQALPLNQSLPLTVTSEGGQLLWQEDYIAVVAVPTVVLLLGDEAGVRTLVINDPGLDPGRGGAVGLFINGLELEAGITLKYWPVVQSVNEVLSNPALTPTPDDEAASIELGQVLRFGQFIPNPVYPGDYRLEPRNAQTGALLGQFFFQAEANGVYYYLVTELGGEISLIPLLESWGP
jgi:hypothetical protein